jgi:DNA-binding protein H-NS
MILPSSSKDNSMTTLKALQEKIAKLQAQAEAIAKKETSAVLKKIWDLMEKHGLTTEDIAVGLRKTAALTKSTATKTPATPATVAKYVNRKTGATWSGRGRAPGWITDAEDRSDFLVKGGNSSATVAKKAPKARKHVRGTQALVYRDPETGSTWSGGGRAPVWLATAKNPIEYLIPKTQAFPQSVESSHEMHGVNKPAAKAAGAASNGIEELGDSDLQSGSEEVAHSSTECGGTVCTP